MNVLAAFVLVQMPDQKNRYLPSRCEPHHHRYDLAHLSQIAEVNAIRQKRLIRVDDDEAGMARFVYLFQAFLRHLKMVLFFIVVKISFLIPAEAQKSGQRRIFRFVLGRNIEHINRVGGFTIHKRSVDQCRRRFPN